MLILTRRVGEKILIGNDIEVSIRQISGGQVRIGIIAPFSYTIKRAEIDTDESFDNELDT